MKLWKKIGLYSCVFFLLVFWASGILMIEKNKKIVFERTLQQATSEQMGISSGIMRYVMLQRAKESTLEGSRDKEYVIEYLDSRVNSWGIYLEIRDGDEILYSNLNPTLPIAGKHDGSAVLEYKVQEIEDKKYLVLGSIIPLQNKNLTNTYITDISGIYTEGAIQHSFFQKLFIAVTVILAVGMYLIVGHLTKSLRALTESVIRIGKGNYKERVQIHAKDEVGELAASYNEMAEAIEGKIRELEEKSEEQQRFIDNFTHELRTPLTAVVGYADLLRSTSWEADQAQELGERIFREGKRIEKLSRLMMDLIFLERHSFQFTPWEAGDIIKEAVKRFEVAAAEAKIQLKYTLTDSGALILGEKELLIALLSNLLDNAKKASGEGETVSIRGGLEADAVVLEVEDEGKGISEEDKMRVFERFYMADKVRSGKNSGIGIGLSICADIAKIHSARIELNSEEGKGTRIKIIFPCYKQDTK